MVVDQRRKWGFFLFGAYLFVELDFAVQVLLCERGKVLDFLRVVGFYLCHRRVQDGLASRSNFLVRLLRRERKRDMRMRTISSLAERDDVPLVLLSLLRILIMCFDGYLRQAAAKCEQVRSVRTIKDSYRI